jgi:hypothetical protein
MLTMAKVRDLKLYEFNEFTDDLDEANGDFVAIESDTQHVKDIILSFPGWWKNSPSIGVGVTNYIGSPNKLQQLNREIRLNLLADNFDVEKLALVTENLKPKVYITAKRKGYGA